MSLKLEVWDLPPPSLEFGTPGSFTDPKGGLEQAGPFSLRFGVAHKAQVRVGLVGTPELIDQAQIWFWRCQQSVLSGHTNRVMYPDFPGFQQVFRSALEVDSRWRVEVDADELANALKLAPRDRFQSVLDLYARGIQRLANSEIRPDVTVCCLPEPVVQMCRTVEASLPPQERRQIRKRRPRAELQLPLFPDWEVEETEEDLLHRDFRRALKAHAMACRMPIQLGTSKLFLDSDGNQDPATRAWNVCLALFYKAGGIPWRLQSDGPETCFVGISFHHLRTNRRHLVYSSLAQAFPSEGEGFALRGDAVPWGSNQGRQVHLTDEQAYNLADQVLAEYKERTGRIPTRVVLHKTSKYDSSERAGFTDALHRIPVVELVNLQPASFRLVRDGVYPPKRGTLCRVNDHATYLFTTGYIPEWGTYPGPHIPSPVQLVHDEGADVHRIASDILGLSRMNWNTARDTSGIPITVRFAREVGGIMAEVGPDIRPHPSYRYYM